MISLGKDTVLPFDVDKTLIFWMPHGQDPHNVNLKVDNYGENVNLKVDYYGEEVSVIPHLEHIQLLRANLGRGRGVVVWSGNGEEWAKNVLKALIGAGLLEDSDAIVVMSKPVGYVDDMDCSTWMGNRIYIEPHSNPYAEEK